MSYINRQYSSDDFTDDRIHSLRDIRPIIESEISELQASRENEININANTTANMKKYMERL